jgi:hypothetical protein
MKFGAIIKYPSGVQEIQPVFENPALMNSKLNWREKLHWPVRSLCQIDLVNRYP